MFSSVHTDFTPSLTSRLSCQRQLERTMLSSDEKVQNTTICKKILSLVFRDAHRVYVTSFPERRQQNDFLSIFRLYNIFDVKVVVLEAVSEPCSPRVKKFKTQPYTKKLLLPVFSDAHQVYVTSILNQGTTGTFSSVHTHFTPSPTSRLSCQRQLEHYVPLVSKSLCNGYSESRDNGNILLSTYRLYIISNVKVVMLEEVGAPCSPRVKKFNAQLYTKKLLLPVFSVAHQFYVTGIPERETTEYSPQYIQTLQHLQCRSCRVRSGLTLRILQHDHARPHNWRATEQALGNLKIEPNPHPLISPFMCHVIFIFSFNSIEILWVIITPPTMRYRQLLSPVFEKNLKNFQRRNENTCYTLVATCYP